MYREFVLLAWAAPPSTISCRLCESISAPMQQPKPITPSSNCWGQTSSTAHRFPNRIESDKHGDGCDDADEPASRPRAENSNDSAEGNGPPEGPLKRRLSVQKEK